MIKLMKKISSKDQEFKLKGELELIKEKTLES